MRERIRSAPADDAAIAAAADAVPASPERRLGGLFDSKDYAAVVQQVARLGLDDAVQALAPCDLKEADGNGDTVLHVAARLLHRSAQLPPGSMARTFQAFVDAGADLNAANRQGDTPLILAVADWFEGPDARDELLHNAQALAMLMDLGADPSLRNANGLDALAVAAQGGSHMAVRKLLRGGAWADARAPQTGATAARHLVRRSNGIAILLALADPPPTPLQLDNLDVLRNCKEVAHTLAEYGASIWDRDLGMRHDAMCAPWLRPAFAGFRPPPPESVPPSCSATMAGALARMWPAWLRPRMESAPPSPENTPRTRAAAMIGALAAGTPDHEIAEDDLRAVVLDNHFNRYGDSVLEAAIRKRRPQIVRRMLEMGADPNGQAAHSPSAPSYLALAASVGQPSTLRALLHHEAREAGLYTALSVATRHPRIVHAWVTAGVLRASPAPIAWKSAVDAALRAAKWGQREMLRYLLEFMPDAGRPPQRFSQRDDLDDVRDPELRKALVAASVFHLYKQRRAPLPPAQSRLAPDVAMAFAAIAYDPNECGPGPLATAAAAPARPATPTAPEAAKARAAGPSP